MATFIDVYANKHPFFTRMVVNDSIFDELPEVISDQEEAIDVIYGIVHQVVDPVFREEFQKGHHASCYFKHTPLELYDVRGRTYRSIFSDIKVVISPYSFLLGIVSDDDVLAAKGTGPKVPIFFERCPEVPVGHLSVRLVYETVAAALEKIAEQSIIFRKKLPGKTIKIILDGNQLRPHVEADLSGETCTTLFDHKRLVVVLVKERP
jgi:hypothetical protein